MHPFALNKQAINLVTGGSNGFKLTDGQTFDDRLTGVAPPPRYPVFKYFPIYTTMAIGEEGGEYPVDTYR
ncbi:hypothetical protein D1814_06915 [Alteromonas sp. BL110]|uniref:hypothetical protein n=1 Tax=Alteromonas sp. BL110 TaxID=1714845 RepID=UPI000E506224|nr:hypothetical protein [Alteromonas sp. BL110]AXT38421.1 hypothetical protein D1814_06915 [Alteromonas sp. BL110]RKM83835.1 hypothetical protein D7031_02015 [Alteromonas sp. BL110]|tara:strand:+ start:9096 stop:9305 length:210 start_codon:yes stop_codon:yes gene_type:complete